MSLIDELKKYDQECFRFGSDGTIQFRDGTECDLDLTPTMIILLVLDVADGSIVDTVKLPWKQTNDTFRNCRKIVNAINDWKLNGENKAEGVD